MVKTIYVCDRCGAENIQPNNIDLCVNNYDGYGVSRNFNLCLDCYKAVAKDGVNTIINMINENANKVTDEQLFSIAPEDIIEEDIEATDDTELEESVEEVENENTTEV